MLLFQQSLADKLDMQYINTPSTDKKALGRFGENLALEFLLSQNYKIIAPNLHSRYGEIDIIAAQNKQLVFVEVKTRKSTGYGSPEDAVNPQKIERLIKTVYIYLEKTAQNKHWRLDAITIQLKADFTLHRLNHYKNIC